MRFVADEGVEARIVERLRFEGHDVDYVAELAPGITDDEVLDLDKPLPRESRKRLAGACGFGKLVFRLRRVVAGVLLVRLAGLSSDDKAEFVAAAVRDYGDQMPGAFAVISPSAIRIRPPV